jgi:hypothetical protein
MIVGPRQLLQWELSPMVSMQVIYHVGFNDLVLLYCILKWCLQPCFQKHSN